MTGDELARRLERARALRAERALEPAPAPAPDPGPSPAVGTSSSRRRGPGSTACYSCGAPLRWAELPSGARVPCDAAAVEVVSYRVLVADTLYDELDPAWVHEHVLYRRVPVQRWIRGRLVDATAVDVVGGVVVPRDVWPTVPRVRGARPHLVSCLAWADWIPHRGPIGRIDPATGAPYADRRD